MEYEQIQNHFIQDIYRLEYGILLKINKYVGLKEPNVWFHDYSKIKNKTSKLKGIKNAFLVTQDFEHWKENIITGTYIFESHLIKILDNPKDYWFELKFSGGAFEGKFNEYVKFNQKVLHILNTYTISSNIE